LVVCTRDRVEHLRRLLHTVGAQRSPVPFELVVVDNGSRDETPRVLEEYAPTAPMPTRVVHEARPGLGRARNRGIESAAGELVAFTDDDCLLPVDHVAAVARAFHELPHVDWLAGRIVDAGAGQARVALLEDTSFRYFPPHRPLWVGAVQGANLAARRAVLEAVGGFDERLGAGTPFRCEDVELCARLAQWGARGARSPDLVVVHAHGRDEAAARALDAANDAARGAFGAQRLREGGATRCAYARLWAAEAAGRFGWRPRNSARAVAIAGRELRGAVRWTTGPRRRPTPLPGPAPAPAPDEPAGAASA
jgi:GT2 family glycosyltransferase